MEENFQKSCSLSMHYIRTSGDCGVGSAVGVGGAFLIPSNDPDRRRSPRALALQSPTFSLFDK